MRAFVVVAFLATFGSAALAKDVALILNDQQRASLVQILDLATKAYGLQVAPVTVQLKGIVDAAPEVTQQTPTTQDAEPKNTQELPK